MPALALMLLVAPEFARLAVLPVLAVLLAARCLAPPAAPCALPYWRAVAAGVLLAVPLVVLTASLGLVAWGLMSRYESETAASLFWARDIVLQVSWLPFDLGVLYFFNPAVVLVLLPATRLPRGVLIGLFVALVVMVETGRVLCLASLVAPRLRSAAQVTTSSIAALLLCTLSVPLAALSRRAGQPHRANPWIAISLALAFYTLSVALGVPSIPGSMQTRYALLVAAACLQACALAALLAVFYSPTTPHAPAMPTPIRLSGYATPERQRGARRSAASMQTFMSLRDPFASPPPTILREKKALGLSPLSSLSTPPNARTRRRSVDSLGLDAAFLEKLVELSFSECEASEDGTGSRGSVYWHGHEFGVLARSPPSVRASTPTPMPRAYRAGLGSPPSTPPSLVISSPASSSRDWTRALDSSLEPDSESSECSDPEPTQ